MEPATIRVLTWNLWWQFGDWQARFKAIKAVLADVKPDIACFQETWHGSDEGNQAELLAAEFDMYGAFAASPKPGRWRSRVPGSTAGVGNAVISRWPIPKTEIAHLPGDDGRILLHAMIDAPAGRLDCFTTHFTSAPFESATRVSQVKETASFIAAKTKGVYPPILTGDLNALPASDEIRLLGGYLTKPVVKGKFMVDAWSHADPSDPGFTWDRANPIVAGHYSASGRIDYIMVGPWSADLRGAVVSVRRIGTEAVDGVWPSDHAGVLAELRA